MPAREGDASSEGDAPRAMTQAPTLVSTAVEDQSRPSST